MNPATNASLIAALLVLAGCVGSENTSLKTVAPTSSDVAKGSAEVPQTGGPSDPSAAVGTIAGTVTDDEMVPIDEARVAIVALSVEVRTDAAGAYRITNIPVGTYDVAAAKVGYEAGLAKRVVVVDGETSEANLLLIPLPSREPTTELYNQKGQRSPLLSILTSSQSVYAFGGSVWHLETTKGRGDEIVDIVAEHAWTNSESLAGPGSYFSIGMKNHYNEGNAHHFCAMNGPTSPLSCVVDREKIAKAVALENADCGAAKCAFTGIPKGQQRTTEPVKVGVTAQQNWETWVTVFYGDPMPKGYSARPPP